MKKIHLNLTHDHYSYILQNQALDNESVDALHGLIKENNAQKMMLYGKGLTADCIRTAFSDYIEDWVDSNHISKINSCGCEYLLLAMAPGHYRDVEKLVKQAATKQLTVVYPFVCPPEFEVKIILETVPRSGTNYTWNSLIKGLNMGRASACDNLNNANSCLFRDIYFSLDKTDSDYIVSSHFFKPVNDFSYRRQAKIMYLFSYFFDSFYSWGNLIRNRSSETDLGYRGYRLEDNSAEWHSLLSKIYHMKQWLSHIKESGGFYLRYEDYFLMMDRTLDRVGDYLKTDGVQFLTLKPKNTTRTYWSGNYADLMDKDVFETIYENFYPYLKHFYPEKMDSLRYR